MGWQYTNLLGLLRIKLDHFVFVLSEAGEKAMATHSSTLAWEIPWMEEPGRLQSMGSLRVGQNWVTSLSLFTFLHWRRKWQPTPVFLPGESQGWKPGGLPSMGLHRAGHDWCDLAAAVSEAVSLPRSFWTWWNPNMTDFGDSLFSTFWGTWNSCLNGTSEIFWLNFSGLESWPCDLWQGAELQHLGAGA